MNKLEHLRSQSLIRWQRRNLAPTSQRSEFLVDQADRLTWVLESMIQEQNRIPVREKLREKRIVLIESDMITHSSFDWSGKFGCEIFGSRDMLRDLLGIMDKMNIEGGIIHVSQDGDEVPVIHARSAGKKIVALISYKYNSKIANATLEKAHVPCVEKSTMGNLQYMDDAFAALASLF